MLVRLGSTAAVIAIAAALWRPAPSVITVVLPAPASTTTTLVPFVVPVPITIEAAAPAPLARMACPPARDDAPSRIPMHRIGATHVMVAPTNAGWVAAWNDTEIYVSRDAGVTFEPALAGTEHVRDVTFDCFGRAIAVRAKQLGVHDATGDHWHAIPGIRDEESDEVVLAGGGPDVAILAAFGDGTKPHLASSHDGGATWRHREVDAYWEGARSAQLREESDGTLRIKFMQPDCMSTHAWWSVTNIDSTEAIVDRVGPGVGDGAEFVTFGNLAISHRQFRRVGEDWADIAGLPDPDSVPDTWPHAIPGAMPAVVIGDDVYRVIDGKARQMKIVVGATAIETIDRAGRVWGINCGRPVVLGPDAVEQTCGADI